MSIPLTFTFTTPNTPEAAAHVLRDIVLEKLSAGLSPEGACHEDRCLLPRFHG